MSFGNVLGRNVWEWVLETCICYPFSPWKLGKMWIFQTSHKFPFPYVSHPKLEQTWSIFSIILGSLHFYTLLSSIILEFKFLNWSAYIYNYSWIQIISQSAYIYYMFCDSLGLYFRDTLSFDHPFKNPMKISVFLGKTR